MIRLLARVFLIGAANLVAGLTYVELLEYPREFAPWETFSALNRAPHDRDVPYVFLGSSHAARFSGCSQEVQLVRTALGGETVHLAKTASGVFQHRLFLQEFYDRGNRAETVVYFVDPFVFYSEAWNEQVPFIEFEPLDFTFGWSMIAGGVGTERMHTYCRSKFSLAWFELRPVFRRCTDRNIGRIDADMVKKRLAGLYWEGTSPDLLARYLHELDRIIELARAQNSELVLMSPPTLLGPEPDGEMFRSAIWEREERYGLRYHDFRDAIRDPAMFRDHDHLNTEGVALFMEAYVGPALLRAER